MAKIHGKLAQFWMSDAGGTERELTSYLDSIEVPGTSDSAETSAFSDEDKTYVNGLKGHTVRGGGKNSYTANGPDDILSNVLGGGASGTITPTFKWAPGGSTTGLIYYTGTMIVTGYSPSAPLGGAQAFSFDGQVTGAVTRGTF